MVLLRLGKKMTSPKQWEVIEELWRLIWFSFMQAFLASYNIIET
jgi:hypothetical protein